MNTLKAEKRSLDVKAKDLEEKDTLSAMYSAER